MKKINWKKASFLTVFLALVVLLLLVIFLPEKHALTYNSMGGHFEDEEATAILNPYSEDQSLNVNSLYQQLYTKSVRSNATLIQPEPVREGYDFVGWYYATIDEEGNLVYGEEFVDNVFKKNPMKADMTVYAKWEKSESPAAGSGGTQIGVFNKDNVLAALEVSWKGMLGIFVVMTIIFVVIVLLNTLTNKKKMAQIKTKMSSLFKK